MDKKISKLHMDKIFSKNVVGSISFLWIVFVFSLLIIKRGTIMGLHLNEIGDFIAGTFAPLGFFWLVAGFYQQGKGLEQNSDALKMQAAELEKTTQALELQVQEMKASVKQQSRLAKVYEEELEQKHFQVKPNLEYNFKQIENYTRNEPICDDDGIVYDEYEDRVIVFELMIKNIGETARNLLVKSVKNIPYIRKSITAFQHSDILTIKFEINGECAFSLNENEGAIDFFFEVSYQDVYGKAYNDSLMCEVESFRVYELEQTCFSVTLEKLHTAKQ